MNAIEVATENGLREERQVRRLSAGEAEEAVNDFVWARLGTDVGDEEFDAFATGCRVLYRDDYDSGRSWFRVVDAQGHGDGSGTWAEVE